MAENGDEEIGDHTDAMRIVGARQASDAVSPDPEDDPFASWFEPGAGSMVKPVTAATGQVEVAGEEFHLPDWTSPPTGVVPKVVASESTGPMTATGPVFRGSKSPMADEAVDFDDLAEDHLRVGALRSEDSSSEWEDWEGQAAPASAVDPGFEPSTSARTPVVEADRPRKRSRPSGEVAAVPAPSERRRRSAPSLSKSVLTGGGGEEDRPDMAPKPRRRPPPEAQRGNGTRSKADTSGVGGDRDMGQAVGIGVLLVLIGAVCFAVGPIPTLLLITAVIGAATIEFVGTLHHAGYNPAGLVVIAGTVGLLWGAFFGGPAAYPIVIGVLVITTLLWFLFVHQGDQIVLNIGVTLLATLYVGGLGSFAALMAGYPVWANLDSTRFDNKFGIGLLVAAVVASVSYDVAGYFVGRSFGATPLGETLRKASPNKTQEGLIAGVIVSIIATFVFVLWVKLPILGAEEVSVGKPVVGLLALGCALVAPLGDLCESMIKRDLDVKDMSQTLPGHGGILDRFDALLFVLPVAYFVATAFVG